MPENVGYCQNRGTNGKDGDSYSCGTTSHLLAGLKVPSYPTRSLNFLSSVRCTNPAPSMAEGSCNAETGKAALVHLKILVVGAGIGGLAAGIALARRGHNVTIFEQAPQMGEVGAGIQMPSNTNRLLLRWGLGPFLGDKVVEPEGMSFRRWKDGSLIGYTKLVPDFQENFEAPYYVVHRAHLHDSMRRLAVELGVEIRTACRVMSYDTETPSLTLQDGISFTGDLIIAADGINSSARRVILGVDTPPLKTGLAAYRATVDVEKIRQDPEIAWIVAKPCLNLWIGEMRHVMTYTIAGGKSFNIVLNHAEDTHPSTWNQDSNIADMREQFGDWDPQLTKIIYMIDRTMKWPLMTGATLGKWTSPSGKLLMLGDAAHAMLPYMSQGAGMAIEDAAGLAEALSKIHSKDELSIAVNVFEAVRVKRSNQMQEASMINSKLWHFPDGPVQEARDEAMRPETEGRHFDESPNQWSDPVTQAWCYGYDAEKEVAKAW